MRFCKILLTKCVLCDAATVFSWSGKRFLSTWLSEGLFAYTRPFSAPGREEKKKRRDEIARINVASPRWWASNEIHGCFKTAHARGGRDGAGRAGAKLY